jgi:hypothetical protein
MRRKPIYRHAYQWQGANNTRKQGNEKKQARQNRHTACRISGKPFAAFRLISLSCITSFK